MSDLGGIEAIFYWKSSATDLTSRDPSMQIVAVPLDVDKEFLLVEGGVIRLQVLRANVNDNDITATIFGECAGNITVYPGYIAKQMEPPLAQARTYFVDWAVGYLDEQYWYISARYRAYEAGEGYDFVWGKEG